MVTLAPPTDPAALPFLPLIYVSWADGDLTGSELESIRTRILETPAIRPETRKALREWLEPDSPPSPRSLQKLLGEIRKHSAKLPPQGRRSLARLGEAMAGEPVLPEVSAALDAIEDALGMVGMEAARELAPDPITADLAAPPDPDAEALQIILDGEHAGFRERLRRLLSEPRFERRYGLSKEEYRELVLSWCRVLASEGLGSLSYPREYGGQEDEEQSVVAFETLAFHDLSLTIKYGVQFGLFGGAVRLLGGKRHHEKYLAETGRLELPGCYAMTELGHGSNVFDLETEAIYDPGTREFVVNTPTESARKEYIGNAAAHGRMAAVFAQLRVGDERHGVHALLVPIRNDDGTPCEGVRFEDCGLKLGLNGVDNGRLWFDQVRVPRENLLNRYSDVTAEGEYISDIPSVSKRFFVMLGALVAGRVSVAWAGLSAMKSGLAIAVRYGDRRRQFGPNGAQEVRLLDYRTHQRRLLPLVATAYALDFALKDLTKQFVNRSEDQREIESLAAGLKAYATWRNIEALQTCRECCGGQGYLAENRFADLKADSDIFCTFEGDNTVLMQLVTKGMLGDFRRHFEDGRAFTIFKYLAARATDTVGEPNPVAARVTDSEHLRGEEFQLDALRYRERRLLRSLARRLQAQISDGADSFQALNQCQDHAVAAAEARVERIVLESSCSRAGEHPLLRVTSSLFGLSVIERDRAWFLESGYLANAKSQAIRTEVNRLCTELRPSVVTLVNGFGIPEKLLAAPIA